jgi:hypothetical protein
MGILRTLARPQAVNRSSIVVFLQNSWFPEGTRASIIKRYADDLAFRRRVLVESATGRRLLSAFGETWFNRIHWDNATPIAGIGSSDISLEADPDHILRVIHDCRPTVVGTMGTTARVALASLLDARRVRGAERIRTYSSPHPNARGVTALQLQEFASAILDNFQAA